MNLMDESYNGDIRSTTEIKALDPEIVTACSNWRDKLANILF